MQKNTLPRYRLGLAVLALFTLGMAIMLIMQASAVKQDNTTYQKALTIADKLNAYTNSHSTVPSSLEAAGVKDVPTTITYTKKSDTSYSFCANYKSSGGNFAVSSVTDNLSGTGLSALGSSSSSSFNFGSDNFDLVISPNHKKGNNCQTVTVFGISPILTSPSISSGSTTSPGSSSFSDPYAACNAIPLDQEKQYEDCVKKVDTQQSQTQVN